MNDDIAQQILRDYADLRRSDADPELEAVRAAIFLEDVFGTTLSEAEIDPAVLADESAMAALATHPREGT